MSAVEFANTTPLIVAFSPALRLNTPPFGPVKVRTLTPGPTIVTLTAGAIGPDARIIVPVSPGANAIVSPLAAAVTAARSEPAPVSASVVTVWVAADAGEESAATAAAEASNRDKVFRSVRGRIRELGLDIVLPFALM